MEGHYIVAGIIILMILSLVIYFFFLWGSKERSEKIEKRGMIPFSDEPIEEK